MHCRSHADHESLLTPKSTGKVLKLSLFLVSQINDRNPDLGPPPPEPPVAAAPMAAPRKRAGAARTPPAAAAAPQSAEAAPPRAKRLRWAEQLCSYDGKEGELLPPIPDCPLCGRMLDNKIYVPDVDTVESKGKRWLGCDSCNSEIPVDTTRWTCYPCEYDLCQACSHAPLPSRRPASPAFPLRDQCMLGQRSVYAE